MKRATVIGMIVVAACAFAGTAASSVWAAGTSNPFVSIRVECETLALGNYSNLANCQSGTGYNRNAYVNGYSRVLTGAGLLLLHLNALETLGITAKATTTQKLVDSSAKITIACSGLKLASGANLKGGEPGTDEETIEYSGCEVEGSPKCEINKEKAGSAKITTKGLTSRLVFRTKAGAEKETAEETATLFKPASGTEFAALELKEESGGTCPSKGTIVVRGEVLLENVGSGEASESHELSAPDKTSEEEYFENPEAKKEKLGKALTLSVGGGAKYEGKSTVTAVEGDWGIME
jgi:hypothetical protein